MNEIPEIPLIDRELSWIDFNARVLAEAIDSANPLLERLKFLGIVSSNFDEFFMVRVAGVRETDPSYQDIYEKAFGVMEIQNKHFAGTLEPALRAAGLNRVFTQELKQAQRDYLKNLFEDEILSLLTPIAIREEHEPPVLVHLSLYRVFELADPKTHAHHYAVVEIPKNYARLITLPADEGHAFILLEDVVSLFAGQLFPGYERVQQGLIRITRAADMTLDEEKDEDFAKVMTEALRSRRASFIVRMEASEDQAMTDFFKARLGIEDHKVFYPAAWFDLKGISRLAFLSGFQDLKRPRWEPQAVPAFEKADDLWTLLREQDVLMHHPYESFGAFIRFLSEAAGDRDVLAIKQTLYRTGEDSEVIAALERAAENGKQVTVLVEIKARFDERQNIEWAKRLIRAGATVLYGVAGLKTHGKACLVVRREEEGLRRYVHLSTGNYNEKTAALYCDLGYLTSREDMARDVSAFFNVVTGYSHPTNLSKLTISPFGLRRKLERLILRESMRGTSEQPGLIMAKMNSLVDREMIEALYRASQAGVKILLNVRGICCLQPGIKGVSENIEVVSLVDMFLEHSRIFYFFNGGDEEVYLSSADWMPRNLDRRLEILFPVEDSRHCERLKELLKLYFQDNQKAWQLGEDGLYRKKQSGEEKAFRLQDYLCKRAQKEAKAARKGGVKDLRPQRPKVTLSDIHDRQAQLSPPAP